MASHRGTIGFQYKLPTPPQPSYHDGSHRGTMEPIQGGKRRSLGGLKTSEARHLRH
ncbi:hypothetical protein A2U01_0059729, partial [Trifolium medium]|nr:hypothetical protein [Trifolium medium]